MRKTFLQLKREVARNLQMPVDGPYQETNIRDYLQNRYHILWNDAPWRDTIDILTVTATQGGADVIMPPNVSQVYGVWDDTAKVTLDPRDLISLVTRFQNEANNFMAPRPDTPVSTQPSLNDTLNATSSSLMVDDGEEVSVEGYDPDGIFQAITVEIGGYGVVNPFKTITAVTKSTTDGVISLVNETTFATIALLGPYDRNSALAVYHFVNPPTQDKPLSLVVKLKWRPFASNTSIAPFDVDAALIAGATSDGLMEHRKPDLADPWEGRFNDRMAEAKVREFNSVILPFAPLGRY